jgi:hypothetical protein
VARVRVTVCYAVIVTAVTAVMVRMDPDMHEALIRHASTNLHNLGHGHVGTLFVSAFLLFSVQPRDRERSSQAPFIRAGRFPRYLPLFAPCVLWVESLTLPNIVCLH